MANIVIKDLQESRELDSQALAKVIGGFFNVPSVGGILGPTGTNIVPGGSSWVSDLFGGIRQNYPQVWYPSYPLSYPGQNNFTGQIDSWLNSTLGNTLGTLNSNMSRWWYTG